MNKDKPRWIHEIPKPIPTGREVELSEADKDRIAAFRKAIDEGGIDAWIDTSKKNQSNNSEN